ncbi:protein of unknown function [Nocardia cyriacigeorgica GUH-2]|uniref:Uncharacterized protein n=1 Tax=Nocardia cyriacigeorgica (strain GUH-2) TaxID=1127134 RepID=H6R0V9_NOCCG|nr:protein of unknown function [Nocardia cyriacigeorgica GUH-2]
MPQPLETKDQVASHLAQIFDPSREYRIYRIEHGWVCSPIPTTQETATGRDIGLTKLVVDGQTGTVIQYPSWSTRMVETDYTEARRTGRPPQGAQVYPKQWQVSLERIRENAVEIEYRLTTTSRTQPPQHSEGPLVINKQSLEHRPTGTMQAMAVSRAKWRSELDGTWPEREMFEV